MAEDRNTALAAAPPSDPVAQLFAMAESLTPDALERMVALAERVQDRQAAIAIQDAHTGFQAECPSIVHNDEAEIATKSGARYSYTFASLDHIARQIAPYLAAHGLSYTWDSTLESDRVSCTCTLRHVGGGERTATFTAPTESDAKMSGAQRAAAALTYAKRQSLVQVLGITTGETDNDARRPTPEKITAKEAADLRSMIEEVGGPGYEASVLKWAAVESLEDMPADLLPKAIATLEARRKQGAA